MTANAKRQTFRGFRPATHASRTTTNMQHPGLLDIVRKTPRYSYEAYEFLFEALGHTQKLLGRTPVQSDAEAGPEHHVSGPELVRGFVDLGRVQFGRMARVVFRIWGIERTDDIGELVFNLIDANLLSKTDNDSRTDFQGVCDLDEALVRQFEIPLNEE